MRLVGRAERECAALRGGDVIAPYCNEYEQYRGSSTIFHVF